MFLIVFFLFMLVIGHVLDRNKWWWWC